MKLTGGHVELHVPDLAAARRFYVEQLGLQVLQETPAIRLLALRAGAMRISIFGTESVSTGPGAVHLVFGSPDLARTLVDLEAMGIPCAGPPVEAPGFCRYVQIRDPAGNLVEIAEYLRDPLSPA
jgi:catechol 2,3-dioxygenase-like lactoylglutathione lyase family enzyme